MFTLAPLPYEIEMTQCIVDGRVQYTARSCVWSGASVVCDTYDGAYETLVEVISFHIECTNARRLNNHKNKALLTDNTSVDQPAKLIHDSAAINASEEVKGDGDLLRIA